MTYIIVEPCIEGKPYVCLCCWTPRLAAVRRPVLPDSCTAVCLLVRTGTKRRRINRNPALRTRVACYDNQFVGAAEQAAVQPATCSTCWLFVCMSVQYCQHKW